MTTVEAAQNLILQPKNHILAIYGLIGAVMGVMRASQQAIDGQALLESLVLRAAALGIAAETTLAVVDTASAVVATASTLALPLGILAADATLQIALAQPEITGLKQSIDVTGAAKSGGTISTSFYGGISGILSKKRIYSAVIAAKKAGRKGDPESAWTSAARIGCPFFREVEM